MNINLNRLFDQFNRTFFHGRLQKYRVRRAAHRKLVKMTNYHLLCGYYDEKTLTLWISVNLKGKWLRRTILHEMCHIGIPNHGKKFQARLSRLAKAGEAWAEVERDEYQHMLTPAQEYKIAALDLWQWAHDIPRLPFSRVVRQVAEHNYLPVKILLKRYPYLKKAWVYECRTVDKERALREELASQRRVRSLSTKAVKENCFEE